jgi:hypothetical protein
VIGDAATRNGRASVLSVDCDPREGPTGFVLIPQADGILKFDSGTARFCCWSARVVARNRGKGPDHDPGPRWTLVGKAGTLVA